MGSTQFVPHSGLFFDSLSATDSKGGVECPHWHMKDCMSTIPTKRVPYKWQDILVEFFYWLSTRGRKRSKHIFLVILSLLQMDLVRHKSPFLESDTHNLRSAEPCNLISTHGHNPKSHMAQESVSVDLQSLGCAVSNCSAPK